MDFDIDLAIKIFSESKKRRTSMVDALDQIKNEYALINI